jgi:hypothetical protein
MYMCRLRFINDLVLSSLKMEGIRLLLSDKEELHIVTLQFVRQFGGSVLLCLP